MSDSRVLMSSPGERLVAIAERGEQGTVTLGALFVAPPLLVDLAETVPARLFASIHEEVVDLDDERVSRRL